MRAADALRSAELPVAALAPAVELLQRVFASRPLADECGQAQGRPRRTDDPGGEGTCMESSNVKQCWIQ